MKTAPTTIQLNDFKTQWRDIRQDAIAAFERVGESGWMILGSEVKSFEAALARMWGLARAVGCANGLDAIEIALRVLGITPGAKVLTTPLSAFASTLAIVRAGGIPLFADVDESGIVDLNRCETVFREHADVRFFVPVHLYGHAIDLEHLSRLRATFDLSIVEDCAQAIGATSAGRPVGCVGQIAATSFYPTKNLGCMGDGGALLTDDDALADKAQTLRDYGQSAKYEHTQLGLNSRLDEVQAALMRDALLPRLAKQTQRRQHVATRYLAEIDNRALRLPTIPSGSTSVWHLFAFRVRNDRDAFQAHLRERGIQSGVHYPILIPAQRAMNDVPGARSLDALAQARDFCATEVSLPMHPYLSDTDITRVIDACNAWRP